MMSHLECMEQLNRRTDYAKKSRSRDLMYETYGMAKMAYELGVIDYKDFLDFNRRLVREGINNPQSYDY